MTQRRYRSRRGHDGGHRTCARECVRRQHDDNSKIFPTGFFSGTSRPRGAPRVYSGVESESRGYP